MMTDAMTSRLRPVQPGKATLVAVLDIGSTKICCVIARLVPRAEGRSLRGRTHQAEHQAGCDEGRAITGMRRDERGQAGADEREPDRLGTTIPAGLFPADVRQLAQE